MAGFTRNIFHDLAIWMIGFGVLIGLAFPFFMVLMGLDPSLALSNKFFVATVSAGILVGAFNLVLVRLVVRPGLRLLVFHLKKVEAGIQRVTQTGDRGQCTPEGCRIELTSTDELGESARAFNSLLGALAASYEVEARLDRFSATMASQLELEPLARTALGHFLDVADGQAGTILMRKSGQLALAANSGVRDVESLVHNDSIVEAMRTRDITLLDLPEELLISNVLVDFRPRQVVLLPVWFKGDALGVVLLASTNPFSREVLNLLRMFNLSFGVALNNAVTHDQLQRIAALDPLTNTYNRRFGMLRMEEEFERAARAQGPLGLLMMDIDHFKSVNDTYGHLVGDRVLRQMAKAAQGCLRGGDVLIRYGGEEFIAVLPGANTEDSQAIGERIRRSVEETHTVHGEHTICTTISLGCATYPAEDYEKVIEMVQAADKALYAAKANGRNRLVMSGPVGG